MTNNPPIKFAVLRWHAAPSPIPGRANVICDGRQIAAVYGQETAEGRANLALVLAIPDMLRAMLAVRAAIADDAGRDWNREIAIIDSALPKDGLLCLPQNKSARSEK